MPPDRVCVYARCRPPAEDGDTAVRVDTEACQARVRRAFAGHGASPARLGKRFQSDVCSRDCASGLH